MRGAVIKCPNCGAVVNQPGNILRCEYCGTQVRVQRRTGFFERVEAPPKLPPQMLNLPVVIQAHSRKWMTFAAIIPLIMFVGIGSSVFFAIKSQRARTSAATAPLRTPTWNGNLPAARDVNGDGVLDAVGRARVLQPKHVIHVAAYSGKDGKRLWLSDVLGAYDDFEGSGISDEFFLIAKKSGEVTAIKLANGEIAWSARFAERVKDFCAADKANIGVLLADKTRAKLAVADGASTPAAAEHCEPLETDLSHKRGRNSQVRDTHRGGEGPPKRSAFEGMAIGGALFGDGRVRIAYGDKSPGTRTPMLARYSKPPPPDDLGDLDTLRQKALTAKGRERSKLWSQIRKIEKVLGKLEAELVWKVLVPGVDPLSVKGHDPDSGHVSIGGKVVATVYETRDKANPWRVTAFDIENGKRLFDAQVPGDRPMSGVTVAGELVFVSKWGGLYAYSVASGELVWSLR